MSPSGLRRSSFASTVALLIALVCFFVAFLLSASIVHGGHVGAWKDAGLVALVIGLLFWGGR